MELEWFKGLDVAKEDFHIIISLGRIPIPNQMETDIPEKVANYGTRNNNNNNNCSLHKDSLNLVLVHRSVYTSSSIVAVESINHV